MIIKDNALEVAKSRYLMEDETWTDCAERVANTVSSVETDNIKKHKEDFFEIINNMDFLPAGRILRNCGRASGSLLNCYVLPVGDSREEIGQWLKDSLILWGEGGGVGCNISNLRPRGAIVKRVGGVSSGPVSFLQASDAVAKTIESGGSRRAAALACMTVQHPDIVEFIDAKLKHKTLSHYNISVIINNEFLEAVELNKDWKLQFGQQTYGTIKAKELWDKIINNMIECAEPGLIFWDNFSKNNSYYFDPVVSSNPCGEAILGAYGACDLGSLVLPNFITGNVNTNWRKLEQVIKIAVRFLDNVLDANKYVLKTVDISSHNSRRIGLGIIGLAEYLFAKQLKYGSEKSIIEVEKLMKFIRDVSYQASIELSKEKGSFPSFDPVHYSKASFIRKLPVSLRMDIKKYGIRNVTTMAQAPTGTISLLTGYTSGIEPLFAKAYRRKDRVSERIYVHPMYEEMLKKNEEIPEWFIDTFDLKPIDHFNIQSTVQKYTDGAVSKTINLPKETTTEDLSQLLLTSVTDLKGVTVYRDTCRGEQPLNQITKKEALEYIKKENVKHSLESEDVQCATGICDL